MFTKSRFAGPSVTLSRGHLANGLAQAVVVISKNANVATGQQGHDDASEVARARGRPCRVRGRRRDRHLDRRDRADATRWIGFAPDWQRSRHRCREPTLTGRRSGMMTTDTVPKIAEAHRRRQQRPRRRHGQGRRDDRARHGHAHLVAVHRRGGDLRRPRRHVPHVSSTRRSTASASTPTRRRAIPPPSSLPAWWPTSTPPPSKRRSTRVALDLTKTDRP